MSESTSEESTTDDGTDNPTGIGDDQLPDDLVPGEDNPLAEGLDPDDAPDDLFDGGKTAEQDDDDTDSAEAESD